MKRIRKQIKGTALQRLRAMIAAGQVMHMCERDEDLGLYFHGWLLRPDASPKLVNRVRRAMRELTEEDSLWLAEHASEWAPERN